MHRRHERDGRITAGLPRLEDAFTAWVRTLEGELGVLLALGIEPRFTLDFFGVVVGTIVTHDVRLSGPALAPTQPIATHRIHQWMH